jgi:predicted RNase H-like nuclease (RuvC/YqgF family)
MNPVIQQLLKAKKHSDRAEWEQKKAIIHKLLSERPDEFHIDSRQSHTVGLTHKPSRFRIHTLKSALPDEFSRRQMLKAAFLRLYPGV